MINLVLFYSMLKIVWKFMIASVGKKTTLLTALLILLGLNCQSFSTSSSGLPSKVLFLFCKGALCVSISSLAPFGIYGKDASCLPSGPFFCNSWYFSLVELITFLKELM